MSVSDTSIARTAISPCSVNLTALPARLRRICRRRPGSPERLAGTSGAAAQMNSSPLSWARSAIRPAKSSSRARTSKSSVSSSSLPASILEKSRISLSRLSRASRAGAHGLRVSALVLVEGGVQQEARHPDDPVHRGADLVTHVGQEVALGLVGGLGPCGRFRECPVRLFERCLGPLAPGYVPRYAQGSERSAIRIRPGHLGGGNPCHAAVESDLLLLEIHHGPSRPHDLQLVLEGGPGVLLREEVEVRLADRLRWIVQAEERGKCLADHDEAAVGVLEVHRVGGAVHQHFEQ